MARTPRVNKANDYLVNGDYNIGLNNFAYIMFQGEPIYQTGQICFAHFGKPRGKDRWDNPIQGKKIQFFMDFNMNRSDKYPDYAEWVINRSPLSPVFIHTDPKVVSTQATLFDTDYPARAIVCGAIMLRYLSEHPAIIKRWRSLRKKFSDEMAFLILHLFKELTFIDKTDRKQTIFTFNGGDIYGSLYHSFDSRWSPTRIQNWLDKQLIIDDLVSMKEGDSWAYKDLSSIFGVKDENLIPPGRKFFKTYKTNGPFSDEYYGYCQSDIQEWVTSFCKLNDINYEGHIYA